MEQFAVEQLHGILSFDCRKVIGFALLRYAIGLKNSRHFFVQSEGKLKAIVTRSHAV